MEAVLKYPGAKNRLAEWIISFIPEHRVYLELFFGSGAVFFNKDPAKIETLNDLDGEVYNLFKVIRDRPEEFAKSLEMTPYSREEYENAYKKVSAETELERARKFMVRCWLGMGSSNVYKNGFRSSQQGNSPKTTKHWGELPDRVLLAAERLKHAQIEKLPALELLKRYDTPDVFIYLALAGLAIIYSMGANESPKGRRIFFGVLGVVMIVAFVCASIYLHKYGWPL